MHAPPCLREAIFSDTSTMGFTTFCTGYGVGTNSHHILCAFISAHVISRPYLFCNIAHLAYMMAGSATAYKPKAMRKTGMGDESPGPGSEEPPSRPLPPGLPPPPLPPVGGRTSEPEPVVEGSNRWMAKA